MEWAPVQLRMGTKNRPIKVDFLDIGLVRRCHVVSDDDWKRRRRERERERERKAKRNVDIIKTAQRNALQSVETEKKPHTHTHTHTHVAIKREFLMSQHKKRRWKSKGRDETRDMISIRTC